MFLVIAIEIGKRRERLVPMVGSIGCKVKKKVIVYVFYNAVWNSLGGRKCISTYSTRIMIQCDIFL